VNETGNAISFRQQLSMMHLKHLSWRSRWIILCRLERRMPVSRALTGWAVRFGLSFWLNSQGPPHSQCCRVVSCCLVAGQCLSCGFSSVDYRCLQFPTLVKKFTQQPSCTLLTDRFLTRIASSCKILTIILNFCW